MLPELANSWKTRPLGEMCDLIMGQAPKGDTYNEDGAGVMLIAGAADLGPVTPKPKKWTSAPTKLGKKGDIILCVRATIGDLNWADAEYCYGRGVAAIRVNGDVDSEFVWYWLATCKEHLLNLGRGAIFKQISKKDIAGLPIPEIDITEQRRIVARIKECMERLEEIENLNVNQTKAANQVLRAARRELLGSPMELPVGWSEVRMDGLADVIYGISAAISKNKDPKLGPPIVRMANISIDGQLDLSDLRYLPIPKGKKTQFALKPGDLLLNWRSGSAKHVGKTAIFLESDLYTCASFILRIRSYPSDSNNRYLRHVLNFMRAEGVFTGKSRMQINHKLNAKEFSAFPIRIPPTKDDQEAIADQLDAIEAFSSQIRSEIEGKKNEVQELRDSILRKAFAGEL
ncbi:MAG: restriction endonuclease subunit S [Desulfobacterales bacterium]|uniref:Restriction endonuclease subunit S n=1 Tax=Candidatus Desulfatibia vada TaxID=2841696 RepID=A0A8J6NRE3_9BACT|nr:restriction endonuclease subunit S [Candidatus Desulfatibia vada]